MAKTNKLQPVYLMVGTDHLKQNAIVKRLEKRCEEFGDMSFNSSSFDGTTATGTEIVQACATMPFASEKRYVKVINTGNLKKEDQQSIADYLSSPAQHTILALVSDKLAKNTKLYKAITNISSTCVINCDPPKKFEMAHALNNIAATHGGQIDMNAANLLVSLVGEDTMHLNSEISKMLTASKTGRITIADVQKMVQRTSAAKPWDFTNAFSARDVNAAIQILRTMDKNAMYVLLPMLNTRIKELLIVKEMGNPSQNEIAGALGLQGWQVKNHGRWAKNYTTDQLTNALSLSLKCEADIKSKSNANLIFETFVVEIMTQNS